MKKSHWAAIGLLLFATVVGSMLIGGLTREADSSSLSHNSRGWLVARLYLERRGYDVSLIDKPLDVGSRNTVLVLGFPWQRRGTADEANALRAHLARGGTIILAYTGAANRLEEDQVSETINVQWKDARGKAPLNPISWRKYVSTEWRLSSDSSRGDQAEAILTTAPQRAPVPPPSSRILFRGEEGLPLIFVTSYHHGQIVFLPADVFSNCRMSNPGNANLLETLAHAFPGTWAFDEYHHGLTATAAVAGQASSRPFDFLLLQLLFLYIIAVFALAKRFGPAWEDAPVISGSTASFLLGLGAIHDRLGHYRDAAQLLCRRALDLDPHLKLPEPLALTASEADRSGFIRIVRTVSEYQQSRRRKR